MCASHEREREEKGSGRGRVGKVRRSRRVIKRRTEVGRCMEVYKRELFVIHSTNDYHLLTQTHLR